MHGFGSIKDTMSESVMSVISINNNNNNNCPANKPLVFVL